MANNEKGEKTKQTDYSKFSCNKHQDEGMSTGRAKTPSASVEEERARLPYPKKSRIPFDFSKTDNLTPVEQAAYDAEAARLENKSKRVQKHLKILLHGVTCQKNDEEMLKSGKPIVKCCLQPCKKVKEWMNHMPSCLAGKLCPVISYCFSSYQIITHWNHCKISCPICSPFRQPDENVAGPAAPHASRPSEQETYKSDCFDLFLDKIERRIIDLKDKSLKPLELVLPGQPQQPSFLPFKIANSNLAPILMQTESEDQLELTIANLHKNVSIIKKEIENLEHNIRNAKKIQQDLDQLFASKDHVADGKVDYKKNKNLSRNLKIEAEIKQKLQDPLYLPQVQLIAAQIKLEKAKQAISSITAPEALKSFNELLEVQLRAREELECVVCLEVPHGNVFSCSEHHILCTECKQKFPSRCPICRENFVKTQPTRNKLAEKMIRKL